MYLPDKIVIDLYEVDLIIDKIAKLLKNIMKFTKCGDLIDVGNDLEYSLKEITGFKKKLIDLIIKESKKYQSDIFGNSIRSINNYRYVEMFFSEDYKEITSIRLVGKDKNDLYSRYSLFNLENKFDPTVINILFHSDEILEETQNLIGNETKYIEFLQNYFAPFPILHPIKDKSKKCIDDISKKYDDGKPKKYEDVVKQDLEFGSVDFKMPIFDIRGPSFSSIGGISFILPEVQDILKQIENSESSGDPKKVIEIINARLFDKFKIPDITGFIFENLNINLDPFSYLEGLPPIEIFTKIDDLPKDIRIKIYEFLRDPLGPINLDKILIDLQEFMNFQLNLGNLNLDISIALNQILGDLQGLKIPELLYELPKLSIPQADLQQPNFKFTNPDILSKINKFEGIFVDWDLKLGKILGTFDGDVIKNIPDIGQIRDRINGLKLNLSQIKLKFPQLKNIDLNFNIILKEILDNMKNLGLPDLFFNLGQFTNKKAKKSKCSVKLPKKKFNFKLSSLFKKIKFKFPKLYLDFETRFNLLFPKFDFLNGLKLFNFNFDIFNFNIPKFEIPSFKIPSFDFPITDLFGDFSKQLDLSILNGLSSILSNITKSLLELLNMLNKLDDFALENIFPLPELNVPNGVPKFQAAFNEEWLIYIGYVFQLLIETDKQRTEPQVINLPDNITKNEGIRKKIISKNNPIPKDYCEPLNKINDLKNAVNKKSLKKKKIESIHDALSIPDIDGLIEKIKYFNYSDTNDYFTTENLEDETVVDIIRFIAKSLKEQTSKEKPKLPISSKDIIKSTSDMVEQIESLLNQQEINSLLNGTYTEETAEIVRNIAKMNFPNLTYRVDPIKYFRMLGKVIGSAKIPKLDPKNALKSLGVKK